MRTGQVIRTYRKMKNMTQEEMADRLGVSAPAVNKWENGNSMPDIMLIAPIARLLGISTDTLLSFQEDLTEEEVNELVKILKEKIKTENFHEAFLWAKAKMEQYPNSEKMHLWMCIVLDSWQLFTKTNGEVYDDLISTALERLLKSGEESVRTTAADSLYGFYLRKEQYGKAEEYLAYFSEQNPEKKRKRAFLYAREGRHEEACKLYEELLFSGYRILSTVFWGMLTAAFAENDLERAEYLSEKTARLAGLFEMGSYQEYVARLELAWAKKDVQGTLVCAEKMLEGVDRVGDYEGIRLYEHMFFGKPSGAFQNGLREKLTAHFRDEESFGYMKGNLQWEKIIGHE